jgi:hypothetical protein
MEITISNLIKMIFSYPAIVFWITIFSVPSFFISAWLANLLLFRFQGPFFPPFSRLVMSHTTGPLIRIGATGSAIGITLSTIATYRFGQTTLRTAKSHCRFSSRTLVTIAVSGVVSALSLMTLGWTHWNILSSFVHLAATLLNHTLVDLLARRRLFIGNVTNLGILVLASIGILFDIIAINVNVKIVEAIGSFCELIALITIHLRFMINGEIVLGANFMPTEIRPKFLQNPYEV